MDRHTDTGQVQRLEVIETVLAADVRLERPLAVGFFTDEEGSRFAPDMLGSLVYAGGLALEEALEIEDQNGATVGEELERIGYLGTAPCPGLPPAKRMQPLSDHIRLPCGA